MFPASAGGSLTASWWGFLRLVACTSRTRGALAALAFLLKFSGLLLKFAVWRLRRSDLECSVELEADPRNILCVLLLKMEGYEISGAEARLDENGKGT